MKGLISMKIRKLTGILVAAAMIASYGTVLNVTAGADTTVLSSIGYSTTIDSLFSNEGGLSGYISSYISNHPGVKTVYFNSRDYFGTQYISMNSDGSLTSILSADNLQLLRNYYYNSTGEPYYINLQFYYFNYSTGTPYCVTVSNYIENNNGTRKCAISNDDIAGVRSNGGMDLSLSIKTDAANEVLYLASHNYLMNNSVEYPVSYKIIRSDYHLLLSACNLSGYDTLGIYDYGTLEIDSVYDGLLVRDYKTNIDLDFTLDETCRQGIYLQVVPNEDNNYTISQSTSLIREYFYKFLGMNENGQIPSIKTEDGYPIPFNEAKEYIEKAIKDVKNDLYENRTYCSYEEIKQAIDDYCYYNKSAFIEAFATDIVLASDEKIDEKVKGIISDFLSNNGNGSGDSDNSDSDELKESIYNEVSKTVIEDVIEQLGKYNTPLNKETVEVIKDTIDDNISDIGDKLIDDPDFIKKLKDKIGTIQGEKGETGNSAYQDAVDKGYFSGTFAEWLESLHGKDGDKGDKGDQGVAGQDGQDFEEWMKKKYGDEDGFMNEVFKKWAISNFGSVNNFVNSINGEDGQSFETWMKNKYGSENAFMIEVFESWIEDEYGSVNKFENAIRGEDGKSAYEIAVEQGFRGDEDDWLDSLKGEDGKDGEDGEDGDDGEDGKDGQVIYVNGTYGQVPNSGTTTDDVVLVPDNVYYGKPGNVNPATGVAAGIVLPAAAVGSVLLVKKGKRRRGRK